MLITLIFDNIAEDTLAKNVIITIDESTPVAIGNEARKNPESFQKVSQLILAYARSGRIGLGLPAVHKLLITYTSLGGKGSAAHTFYRELCAILFTQHRNHDDRIHVMHCPSAEAFVDTVDFLSELPVEGNIITSIGIGAQFETDAFVNVVLDPHAIGRLRTFPRMMNLAFSLRSLRVLNAQACIAAVAGIQGHVSPTIESILFTCGSSPVLGLRETKEFFERTVQGTLLRHNPSIQNVNIRTHSRETRARDIEHRLVYRYIPLSITEFNIEALCGERRELLSTNGENIDGMYWFVSTRRERMAYASLYTLIESRVRDFDVKYVLETVRAYTFKQPPL